MEEKKETPEKLVLMIPRDQWMRGTVKSETDLSSVLWSESQQRGCCVGHYMHALGVPREELEGLSTLEYALSRSRAPLDSAGVYVQTHAPANRPAEPHGVYIGEGDARRRATHEDFPIFGAHTPDTRRLLTRVLYEANDESLFSEEERESRIKELFATVNVEVVFT